MDTSGTVCSAKSADTSRTWIAVKNQRRPGNAQSGRAKISLVAFASIILLFLTAFIGQANAATMAIDKTDYGSGEVAVITGSGWVPGEVVVFTVTQDPMLYSTIQCTRQPTWTAKFSPATLFQASTFHNYSP